MNEPRAEKVAVVDEVRERLGEAAATVVTEYRGLSVAEMAQLRRNLGAVGADYKVYKNTLVRLALGEGGTDALRDLLVGPTALTFVHGDVSAAAKALRDFSRTAPSLVLKGGLVEGNLLSQAQLNELAELPSREVLLARLAGALQAPLTQLAGLMQALPRNLAYGLSALVDQRGGVPSEDAEATGPDAAAAEAPDAEAEAEASAPEADGRATEGEGS
jgi:large subunit ribosomal protein L10